ncbi:MAG: AbrB/MazE/SpoVT family DNA-binding domain-containing protein [Anaerolineae bacterium]|nr:AbrB/MazE/SpoVT family DNA-binding domain-containing protein [Anaerolineae bacterium]
MATYKASRHNGHDCGHRKKLHSTRVTGKGRITIPARVWRPLGLKAGDRVTFVVQEGRASLVPLPPRLWNSVAPCPPRGPSPGGRTTR